MRISRTTFRNLRKEGVLKAEKLSNGHYDFDPEVGDNSPRLIENLKLLFLYKVSPESLIGIGSSSSLLSRVDSSDYRILII